MSRTGAGAPVLRKEDARLLQGQGRFADDMAVTGVCHAAMVRSPHAHARILSIDTDAARAMPGVLAVLTAEDANADGLKSIPHATGSSFAGADVPLKNLDGSERSVSGHLPLAGDIARFCGEIVAVVVAKSAFEARDAAEAVAVDWEVLPAVTRSVDAISPGAPQLWPDIPGNVALDAEIGDAAETDKAFARATHRVKLETWVHRVTGVHLEPRAAVAEYDRKTGSLVLRASSGTGSVQLRQEIAAVLGMDIEKVRVAAPGDVGGNFGTRNATYPEFVAVCWAARRLGRPVKHVSERQESFLSDYQARDLHVTAELALDASGRFLAVRTTNLSNVGAHTVSFVPLNKGAQLVTSVYAVPVAHVRARAVLTNTPSTIPYRSAGRPEAMFVVERLVDLAAQQCGFDRVALRRKNLIRPARMPWRNPFGVTYDNGAYEDTMRTAMRLGEWDGFAARRRAAKRAGKLRGISIVNYVETTSGIPRERAEITVGADGAVDVIVGTQATGQGHETSFSQLVSEWLGVPFEDVHVRYGDTAFVKAGGGSHSGRSMRFASIVMRQSCDEIIEKGRRIAGHMLEADATDIVFAEGRFTVAGTDRGVTIIEAARVANSGSLPDELAGPLGAIADKVTPGLAFPFGSHVCEIEIDPDTGAWTVIRYVSVDDVGRAINPMILDGQTHGGIVQGLGQALMEQCVYDREGGQLLSGSFMDYAMPRASDFPFFTTELSEVPAASHPLGLRPGGEGGTTPALGAATNAVVDALKDFGIDHIEMPLTPLKIWTAIHNARARQGAD